MSAAHHPPGRPELLEALFASGRRLEGPGGVAWRRWGSGPRDLILLHGGAGSWMHWARNIPFFAQRFRVWVPDLPGMGESALPPEPWTPRSMAAILDEGLQALVGAGARVSLVAFSFGAMIAVHWAALCPERIDCVVGCATAGIALAQPPMGNMRPWRNVADELQRRELHRHNLRAWMLHDPAKADELAAWIAQYSVERDRLRNREVSNSDTTLKTLPLVKCPVHMLYGSEDGLYRHARAQVESALRLAGVSSFGWLRDAGHWAPFERADSFNALVEGMLA